MFTLKNIYKDGTITVSKWETISFKKEELDPPSTICGKLFCQPEFIEREVDLKDSFYIIDQFGNTVMSKHQDVRGAS